jgi:predicted nucleic acid-binding protein
VLAPALIDDGKDGDRARRRLSGHDLAAPELIDLEVTAVLHRALRTGRVNRRRSEQALNDLADLPLARAAHLPLLQRVWDLRARLGPYEAAYVALAEALEAVLLTADIGLSRTRGLHCQVELLADP